MQNLPKDSVARISGRNCPSRNNPDSAINRTNGTGFVWRDRQTLVTAYHVVAGCGTILVHLPGEEGAVSAVISDDSLSARDIAVLTLSRQVGAYPLEFRNIHPPTGFVVQLLGHALGADAIAARQLTVASFPGNEGEWPLLEDVLSTDGRAKVSAEFGLLDHDTKILQVDGDITNGFSGGPVFDFEGYVVGIASGSVGETTSDRVSWAISVEHLKDIAAGGDIASKTSVPQLSLVQFDPDDQLGRPSRLQCGFLEFVYQEAASLTELYGGSEQPDLLNSALQLQSLGEADLDSYSFDIWENDLSGMQVAIPQDGVFLDDPLAPCSVAVSDDVVLQIFTYVAPDTGEYQRLQHFQAVSNNVAQTIQSGFALTMTPDNPMFLNTSREADRYFFTRTAGFHHQSTGFGQLLSNYVVITNHGRERYYVGVAASHVDYTNSREDVEACQRDTMSDRCVAFRDRLIPWTSAFMAAHLSGMPER